MSQAPTTIDQTNTENKPETAIAAAMTTATPRKPAANSKATQQATNPASRAPSPAPRTQRTRQAITFETVKALAPHEALAANLSRTFALDPVDYHAIREGTEEHMVRLANELTDNLNEKALEIHLQRIVDAFVRSAHGAANFYGTKVTEARDLTAASQNDHRDEDREPVYGFQSKAQRARQFAAETGLQAYALMAAAEGAIHAYAHVTGNTWKPYAQPASAENLSRRSAAEELAAFS